MLRPAARSFARATRPLLSFAHPVASRRFLSTAPPAQKSRSWKSLATRFALAGGAIYFYNTSDVFADSPSHSHYAPEGAQDDESLPTIEQLAAERKQRLAASQASAASPQSTTDASEAPQAEPASPEELEEEADQQGAFNPETGEINWDCPCLGGMAHGPCGDEFRAAFSCFVYSTEEPKGMDCIDRFKGMQDCFRQHPDVYGAELEDEEEAEAGQEAGEQGALATDSAAFTAEGSRDPTTPSSPAPEKAGPSAEHGVAASGRDTFTAEGSRDPSTPATPAPEKAGTERPSTPALEKPSVPAAAKSPPPVQISGPEGEEKRRKAKEATEQVRREHEPLSESDHAVPKVWHDMRDSNTKAR